MAIFGFDAKLYRRSTGTYESPTWTEVKNIRDCALSVPHDEGDATTRRMAGWGAAEPGLAQAEVTFNMNANDEDEDYIAFRTAKFARSSIEFMVLDGSKDIEGTEGLRAEMKFFNWERGENVGDLMTIDVSIKPCDSDHPPSWVISPAPTP